jgi:hypothetical protein
VTVGPGRERGTGRGVAGRERAWESLREPLLPQHMGCTTGDQGPLKNQHKDALRPQTRISSFLSTKGENRTLSFRSEAKFLKGQSLAI